VLDYRIAVGFPAKFATVDAIETSLAPTDGPSAGRWQAAFADPDGKLVLAPLLPPGPRSGVYLATFVQTVKPQRISLRVSADDAVRVIVGGKVVVDRTAPMIPYAKPTELTVEVVLEAGWTPVLVKHATLAKRMPTRRRAAGGNRRSLCPNADSADSHPPPRRAAGGNRRSLCPNADSADFHPPLAKRV